MSPAQRRALMHLLASPALLRLMLDPACPYKIAHVWENIPEAGEAPAGVLRHSPEATWRAALEALRSEADEALRAEARVWCLPEFFGSAPPVPEAQRLVELHAHLRGSVPFLHLYAGWLRDERWRARLRGEEHTLTVGGWTRTFAELLRAVAEGLSPHHLLPGGIPRLATRLSNRRAELRALALATVLRRELLVQPGGRGLSSFTDAYGRYARTQKGPPDELRANTRAALDRFRTEGVEVLELRPTFEASPLALHRRLREVLLAWVDHLRGDGDSRLHLGLVVSLFKQEGAARHPLDRRGLWLDQLDALLALLDEEPLLRWFVVGIDAAGRERGCSPLLFAPVVQRLRDWNQRRGAACKPPGVTLPFCRMAEIARSARHAEAALEALLDEARGPLHPGRPRLGLTLHVGEDFAHPLSGLRAIEQAITGLDLGPGDRLGHALAAALTPALLDEHLDARLRRGLDARRRSPAGPVELLMPRAERIADLAWRVGRGPGRPDDDAVALGAELSHLWSSPVAREAFGEVQALGELVIPGMHYDQPPEDARTTSDLCAWVPLDRAEFEHLRQRVLGLVRARGLVIETCPASNRVVAGLKTAPAEVFCREPGLQLAVCTDDPGLFGVWPAAEQRPFGRDAAPFAFTRRAS